MTSLAGRRVLVTRPRVQADALSTALAARGARPILFPTIEIRPAVDLAPLDRALAALDAFAWIAFSSAAGVDVFFDRLAARGATIPAGVRIAAVGTGTARAVVARGARVDFVPSEFLGEQLGRELGDVAGRRILLPRAAMAREELVVELARRGAVVEDITVYQTLPVAPDPDGLAELERGVDAATFTSGSTVQNYFALLGERAGQLLNGALVACIGPVTADAARSLGLTVHVQPKEHTIPGLVAALEKQLTVPIAAACGRMIARPRRLRLTPAIRDLVRETHLEAAQLISPLFVTDASRTARPVASMPGVSQWPVDQIASEAEAVLRLGIPAVLLFGIPVTKDAAGSGSVATDGVVQRALRAIKQAVPDLVVITDVCLCEYTDHGHCGLLNGSTPELTHPHLPDGYLLNDESVEVLGRIAVSHAEAGADIVAPSAMLDGMVAGIRAALDARRLEHVPIMSYSAKFASALYGPFREAAEGAPKHGDRRSHQMDPANAREALRESGIDVAEGADLLMVKPALPYLDIVRGTRERYPDLPLAAYNVSGEYAMVKAAAQQGWLDERRSVLEILTGIRRAGADLIITYHAKDAARWLRGG